ncbi:malto-oligosyltrehalose synthase [Candidatus Xiphinematobacter sp. Idaho Grape]|uniref:malto-oligosyltrehalose synthase n=1 Tax=Candidatus Xiphinematobacter sp. Idaho Grape TaxID=1704307 RepID=UPI000783823F|nr:malto-oligosyltrehalose synthase [Candidatus Xiphinematobacter sp. Idaho Grape]
MGRSLRIVCWIGKQHAAAALQVEEKKETVRQLPKRKESTDDLFFKGQSKFTSGNENVSLVATSSSRIPSATYRLQFHGAFTFLDAATILEYLHNLGITDIYASPYFQAGIESTHGYDIVDYNALNPALGGTSDYQHFISELHRHQMGQLLDFVPNHMGINESLNRWWMDVLEKGPASAYANYFDIDWHPDKEVLSEKVVLPILNDRYGKTLENGDLTLEREGGSFFIRYRHSAIRLPVCPSTYPVILQRSLCYLQDLNVTQLSKIIDRLRSASPSSVTARAQLETLIQGDSRIRSAVDLAVAEFLGNPNIPETFDALHQLLELQAYRLGYWRMAAEEINYRRFFDVNSLAALRVEIPQVFQASHQLLFRLLARGDVTGLRIDHIDGLWDPKGYLGRLQDYYASLPQSSSPLYIVVEKIINMSHEQLPSDWPVFGTTGYDFANQMVHLLTDTTAAAHLTETYQRFIGNSDSFSDLLYEKKRLVMETSFQSEIFSLGRLLDRLSELYRDYRDCTRNLLTNAIREVIACFPVYRTYITETHHPPSGCEERSILGAIEMARRRNPAIDKTAFDFLRRLLLVHLPEGLSTKERDAHFHFIMKFQQCTGPVVAKGLEDTTLYLYNRLIAVNEVGGNPDTLGLSLSEFHRLNHERCLHTPHTLLATSTHDTKRSEDARTRIAAISEVPGQWREAVRRWKRINKKFLVQVGDEMAPSPNEEYFLYQTLLGVWPLDTFSEDWEQFVARIQKYLVKALKEGKVNSSWTQPNEEWEQAVAQFIKKILDSQTGSAFQRAFMPLAEEIARLGAWNSLTETVLKCTVPGIPDFYQGTEIWDFSLVDPDNRRQIDYTLRQQLLESLSTTSPEKLLSEWKNGRIKLFIIQRLLQFRRRYASFFRMADYQPLLSLGLRKDHIISFLRRHESMTLLVVVPRLTAKLWLMPCDGCAWSETRVVSGSFIGSWRNILTEESYRCDQQEIQISDILTRLPVAVLYRKDP